MKKMKSNKNSIPLIKTQIDRNSLKIIKNELKIKNICIRITHYALCLVIYLIWLWFFFKVKKYAKIKKPFRKICEKNLLQRVDS